MRNRAYISVSTYTYMPVLCDTNKGVADGQQRWWPDS